MYTEKFWELVNLASPFNPRYHLTWFLKGSTAAFFVHMKSPKGNDGSMTSKALMNTYGDRAATLIKGEGAWLWNDKGDKYLDALSGIAVCGLGHSHPAITKAITEQLSTLTHCSNFSPSLIKKYWQRSFVISPVWIRFFGNSGAEANEAAIKMARLFGHQQGISLPTVLVMENAFHGRTLATLSASGGRRVQAGFEPLVTGFARAPFDDIPALQKIADNNQNICAIFVEPIQGEGGIRIASTDYLQQLRIFCDQNNWLLMLDEVQTGNGRTGKYFCFQHSGIVPDVVTTSKGLGNGFPIGACLAAEKRLNSCNLETMVRPLAETHSPVPLLWQQLILLKIKDYSAELRR